MEIRRKAPRLCQGSPTRRAPAEPFREPVLRRLVKRAGFVDGEEEHVGVDEHRDAVSKAAGVSRTLGGCRSCTTLDPRTCAATCSIRSTCCGRPIPTCTSRRGTSTLGARRSWSFGSRSSECFGMTRFTCHRFTRATSPRLGAPPDCRRRSGSASSSASRSNESAVSRAPGLRPGRWRSTTPPRKTLSPRCRWTRSRVSTPSPIGSWRSLRRPTTNTSPAGGGEVVAHAVRVHPARPRGRAHRRGGLGARASRRGARAYLTRRGSAADQSQKPSRIQATSSGRRPALRWPRSAVVPQAATPGAHAPP